MAPRIFIDGHAGTTGLRIRERLTARRDLEVVEIDDARRKDTDARRAGLQSADVAILCLPDAAARESVALIDDAPTRVIDASTAHRTDPDFVFGLPELSPDHRKRIAGAARVSNTGCWPTTLILGLRPLIEAGVLTAEATITVHGLSGYSGGGRAMIERWQDPEHGLLRSVHEAPYSLDRVHKHIPEMVHYTGLRHEPQFVPAVGPFECGMRVQVPLPASLLGDATAKTIWEVLDQRYRDEPFVVVPPIREPLDAHEGTFDPQACNGTNRIELHVVPHPSGHVLLVGLLDNLGKGASGNAVQCLNLMLGLPESAGLEA